MTLVLSNLPLNQEFREAISRQFIAGRYVVNQDLVFNRLHIHQRLCGSVSVKMQEYVDKIHPLEVSKERTRQQQQKCSTTELTEYQAVPSKTQLP